MGCPPVAEAPRVSRPPVPGFPELADARVAWAPLSAPEREQEVGHLAGSWQPVIPCGNPACRGGGFDLAWVVEGMLSFRETGKVGILVCSGWEGEGPADAAGGTPCVRTIRYRMMLAYRTPAREALPAPAGEPPKARGSPAGETA